MRIIFTNVSYQGKSLFWEYNQATNKASLIFNSENATPLDKDLIKELCQTYSKDGLVANEDGVFVTNVEEFSKIYPINSLSLVPPLHDNPVPSLVAPTEKKLTPRSFEKRLSERSPFFSKLVKKSSPRSELSESKRGDFKSIELDKLILEFEDSSVFRNTLGVSGEFQAVSERKQKSVPIYLRGSESFHLEIQFNKNRDLYPAKGKLLVVLRELFDNILNPQYVNWAAKNSIIFRRCLYFFMQNTVNAVMQNAPLNDSPTEYDGLSSTELNDKFKGNSALQLYAAKKVRAARAEVMMVNLRYLIDDNLPVDLIVPQDLDQLLQCYKDILPVYRYISVNSAINDPTKDWAPIVKSFIEKFNAVLPFDEELAGELSKTMGADYEDVPRFKDLSTQRKELMQAERNIDARIKKLALTSFRQLLLQRPELLVDVNNQLSCLQNYLVEFSELEYRYSLINDQLNKDLKDDSMIINGFYSFKHVFANYLVIKLKEKLKTQNECMSVGLSIASAVIKNTITELTGSTSAAIKVVTPKLPRSCDENFYLCQEWINGINSVFDEVDSTELLKHPTKQKVIDKYSQSFAKIFEQYVNKKSTALLHLFPDAGVRGSQSGEKELTPRTPGRP